MADKTTHVSDLKRIVSEFVEERDWRQFHSPKNLSMAMAIEASELMEHFQWISMEESRTPNPEKMVEVGEELADVLCYVLAFANELEIDLSETLERKMVKNRVKYPAREFLGRFGHDDPSESNSDD